MTFEKNVDDDPEISKALRAAGPRPAADGEFQTIRLAARHTFDRAFGRRQLVRRRFYLLAAAAAIVIAMLVVPRFWTRPSSRTPASPVSVGTVVAVHGVIPLTAGSLIRSGETIVLPDASGIAVQIEGGGIVRLDSRTHARFERPTILVLDRGAAYVDSENRLALHVRTKHGTFTPIGTLFEVRVLDDSVAVRVREGSVRLDGSDTLAEAGEAIEVRNENVVGKTALETDSPVFDWVASVAVMPEIEGRSLREFLEWIARERGWRLMFETREAEALSRTVKLHGSVRGLSQDEALRSVLLSSGFRHDLVGGQLIIRRN